MDRTLQRGRKVGAGFKVLFWSADDLSAFLSLHTVRQYEVGFPA